MLRITIPGVEFYDDVKEEFGMTKPVTLQLEHSLVSLSKWESKWLKPFLGKEEKTREESLDYIRCMTTNQNVDPTVYSVIPDDVFSQIIDYIHAPMTATWFTEKSVPKKSGETITAEIIYYWMIALNIPIEFQKWHLNRLITLIRVCKIKSQPPKKMGKREMVSQRAALNRARRAKHNTRG